MQPSLSHASDPTTAFEVTRSSDRAPTRLVIPLVEVGRGNVGQVGGKNASLGELLAMSRQGDIRVPDGFATTAHAFRTFIRGAGLEAPLAALIGEYRAGARTLAETGSAARHLILEAPLPPDIVAAIRSAYRELAERSGQVAPAVAVRSSATAEDLPNASFAGQHDSFLNIVGEDAVLQACRRCLASLFTDRAITYREAKGFDHLAVALSVGVQQMVRADLGGAGVIFTADPDTGFPRALVVNANWGFGETVVQGQAEPDSHLVYKPALSDPRLQPIVSAERGGKAWKAILGETNDQPIQLVQTSNAERGRFVLDHAEVLELARWATLIEQHYERAMDIEWAKDGLSGELFIVQARPETVHAGNADAPLRTWRLIDKPPAPPIVTGIAVGTMIANGEALLIRAQDDLAGVGPQHILVAETTDPDWLPAMRKSAGIVTDQGGRTSHAAIVARELGIPAIVGTGVATAAIRPGQELTISCAESDRGKVWCGRLDFRTEAIELSTLPRTHTRLMINLADPGAALRWWRLPARGVGLARMEFVIANHIQMHPMAAAHPERIADPAVRNRVAELAEGYRDPAGYFVETLARGLARIAAVFDPEPTIVRLSDFKSNEYAQLLGGRDFEPHESNPMLGFRGASRYAHPAYRDGFALECRAVRKARLDMGFRNIIVMVPFCRTLSEADQVIAELSRHGLVRGDDGLKIYMMCEIPANVVLAEEFACRFDGFSIGSNDLTQLILGVDRDSEQLAELFDERDPAVVRSVADVIRRGHQAGIQIGICGQAPSNYPEFAAMLVREGIDSISLTPDSFIGTLRRVAEEEQSRDHHAHA